MLVQWGGRGCVAWTCHAKPCKLPSHFPMTHCCRWVSLSVHSPSGWACLGPVTHRAQQEPREHEVEKQKVFMFIVCYVLGEVVNPGSFVPLRRVQEDSLECEPSLERIRLLSSPTQVAVPCHTALICSWLPFCSWCPGQQIPHDRMTGMHLYCSNIWWKRHLFILLENECLYEAHVGQLLSSLL